MLTFTANTPSPMPLNLFQEESVCEAGVVVCVEKVNAVWATEHVLQSFFQDELRVKFKCKSLVI